MSISRWAIWAILVALCCTLASCSAALGGEPMATVTLTQEQNGTVVESHVGDVIAVKLPENASTGYRWSVEQSDPAVVAEQSSSYEQGFGGVGAGGTRIFTFKAVSTGNANLRLKLSRSWESNTGPANRFEASIHVQ